MVQGSISHGLVGFLASKSEAAPFTTCNEPVDTPDWFVLILIRKEPNQCPPERKKGPRKIANPQFHVLSAALQKPLGTFDKPSRGPSLLKSRTAESAVSSASSGSRVGNGRAMSDRIPTNSLTSTTLGRRADNDNEPVARRPRPVIPAVPLPSVILDPCFDCGTCDLRIRIETRHAMLPCACNDNTAWED
jgi:hypothetical protein